MGKLLGIVIKVNRPHFDREFDEKTKLYLEQVGTVFRATVFRFLGLVIKYSRVKTGRLKSAWTPIMDAYTYDYTRFWTYGPDEVPEAIAEGKVQGSFQYDPAADPFKIIVQNSVVYAGYVEEKVGVTVRGPLPVLVPNFEAYWQEGYEYLNSHLDDSFDSGRYPSQGDYPSEVY